jgi:hypothetical protein
MNAHHMSRDQVINNVLLVAQPTKQFVTVEQVASLALLRASDLRRERQAIWTRDGLLQIAYLFE